MQFVYHPTSSLRLINLAPTIAGSYQLTLYEKGELMQRVEAHSLPQALALTAMLMSEHGMFSTWSVGE